MTELNVARNVVLVTPIECRVGSLRRVSLIRGALITPIGKAINVFFSRRLLTVTRPGLEPFSQIWSADAVNSSSGFPLAT